VLLDVSPVEFVPMTALSVRTPVLVFFVDIFTVDSDLTGPVNVVFAIIISS
jgi:hypothetical protein